MGNNMDHQVSFIQIHCAHQPNSAHRRITGKRTKKIKRECAEGNEWNINNNNNNGKEVQLSEKYV